MMIAARAPRLTFSATATIAWLCGAFLVLPMLVVIPFSLTPERYLSFPTTGISFRHYQTLLGGEWLRSILDSLIVATGAAALAILLGTSIAIAIWRLPGPVARVVRVLALAPMIVPGILHALAYYRALAFTGFLDTYTGLIGVHGLKAMPFVFISVSAVLVGMNPNLEQAARSLGASKFQALRRVIIPNIRNGIFAGGFLAFIVSWDEIVVALFITGRKVHTLPKLIWESLVDNLDPAVAAFATVMIAFTVIVIVWWEVVMRNSGFKTR